MFVHFISTFFHLMHQMQKTPLTNSLRTCCTWTRGYWIRGTIPHCLTSSCLANKQVWTVKSFLPHLFIAKITLRKWKFHKCSNPEIPRQCIKRLSKPWCNLKIKLLENNHWLNFILTDDFGPFYTDRCLKRMVYGKVSHVYLWVRRFEQCISSQRKIYSF